jgi:outer membrane lipoprotein SlyB
MKRGFAVAVLAAVLLTGCRAAASGDAAPNPAAPSAPATQPATVAPSPAATAPAVAPVQVDSDLSTVDGLLGDLDDDASKADQAPPDGD